MNLQDKNFKINKKKVNKLVNLFNHNNKVQQNSLNNISELKKVEKISFPNIYSNSNILTPTQKSNINGEKIVNLNLKKINKLYISSKQKNTNTRNSTEFNKINSLSKTSKRDYSNKITNNNKIIGELNQSSTNNIEISKLNSTRGENSILNSITRKNLNYLKNLNKNNLSGFNKPKIKIENSNIDNKSFFNVLSENSSNNNTNTTTKRKTSNNGYLKTEINNNRISSNIKILKDASIKLALNTYNNLKENSVDKNRMKSDLKDYQEINDKIKNIKKPENNIKTIKLIRQNNDKFLPNDKIDSSYKKDESIIKKKIINDTYNSYYLKEDKESSCPEELHFYFINSIQRGKKNSNNF